MMAPRGFLAAALALWGVSLGHAIVGIVLGLAIEATRFVAPSRQPQRRWLVIAVRAVALVAFAKLAYVTVTGHFPDALYTWLRWLPIILLPLPAAQALAGGKLSSDVFVEALRPGTGDIGGARALDTTYAFVAVTLVSAAAGNAIAAWFYLVAALLVAWPLVARMPRKRWIAGAAMIALGALVGYGVHRGLATLQGEIEEWTETLPELFAGKSDPFRERTRIGDLGRIKLSDRVAIRVVPHGKRPPLLLLREASFDRYSNGEWRGIRRDFVPVPREGERWRLREGSGARAVTVRRSMGGDETLLTLPVGAQAIERLPASAVERLPTGAVRARGAPYFISMSVSYDEAAEREPPLGAADLEVPQFLAPVIEQVLAKEGLKRATPRETVAAIEHFFAARFTYTLNLSDTRAGNARTLADFLLRDHKGHCEYFATATALLLRGAGIPARYTVGYSAQEYSDLERAFLVRNRHAHAWTSAFVDGRWTSVDTTPALWADAEGEAARSPFGALMDLASWAFDRLIEEWLARSPAEIVAAGAVLLGAIAALVLLLRARRRRWLQWRRAPRLDPVAKAWSRIEKGVARRGYARARGESPLAWARRLRQEHRSETWPADVEALARSYYRVRFDPAAGAGAAESFIRAARRWRMAPTLDEDRERATA